MSAKYLLKQTHADGRVTESRMFSIKVWDHFWNMKPEVDDGVLLEIKVYKWDDKNDMWILKDKYPNARGY